MTFIQRENFLHPSRVLFCYNRVPSGGQPVALHEEHFERLQACVLYICGTLHVKSGTFFCQCQLVIYETEQTTAHCACDPSGNIFDIENYFN